MFYCVQDIVKPGDELTSYIVYRDVLERSQGFRDKFDSLVNCSSLG